MIYLKDTRVIDIANANKMYIGDNEIYRKLISNVETPQYLPLKYISNVGLTDAWFDSGIIASPTIKLQVKYKIKRGSGGVFISAQSLPNDNEDYRIFSLSDNCYYDTPTQGSSFGTRIYYTDYSTDFNSKVRNYEYGNFYIKDLDANTILDSSSEVSFEPKYGNIRLFYLDTNQSFAPSVDEVEVYAWKIYDGDVLVRDFTPKQKDGINGMYDNVNNKFYSSEGKNNFKGELNYEPQECTSLTITADDVIGNDTTTTIHYTAITNGVNILTGERLENIEIKGDAISESFEQNTSTTDTRQVTVTYTYLGQTATTTITQGVYLQPTANVDLMSNWELAPSETIPNPNPQLYEGVYQSVHKGQGNVKDKMIITFIGMPTFELYIRSNAESNYDYVYCGKLDQAEPTENNNQASTKGNQQSGTALENYTKVEYPNDGGQHTITIVYRKDGGGDTSDDRGYVFFKKPQ